MAGYFMPTRVHMGTGVVRAAAASLGETAGRWLVVTSPHAARACGALDDARAALDEAGCSYELFDGVTENPTIACAYEGAAAAREAGAEAILAIGGGSPMDAGKAMALIAANPELAPERLFSGDYPGGCLPIVCVPTTAGTGSEVTKASILTNDAAQTKSSISTPLIFPALALVDASYLTSLSHPTMVNTVVDALSHAVEGYLSAGAGPVTDALALDAIARIGARARGLAEGALDEGARASLMAASTEAGMVIANTGTTAVHAMGYSLTYFRHIPHGRANGLLLPAWLSWLAERVPERVRTVLDTLGADSLATLATSLGELLGPRETFDAEELADYARRAARAGNIANCPVRPEAADLERIMRAALLA